MDDSQQRIFKDKSKETDIKRLRQGFLLCKREGLTFSKISNTHHRKKLIQGFSQEIVQTTVRGVFIMLIHSASCCSALTGTSIITVY